jgi:nucleoid-associated protein YgaU
MSQLTDKYGDVYIHAQNLGVTNLNAQEENGHITITGNAPSQYVTNQIWDKIKQIDPDLKDGDLTLNLSVARQDIYGEYEVKSGDTLSSIAKDIGRGSLTYQQIFDANRDTLSDPDKIQAGQRLKIPNFTSGQKA